MVHSLRQAGLVFTFERVETEADYVAKLAERPDLVLADFQLPQFDALQALHLLRAKEWDIPFILVSGSIGEETVVSALRLGAADFIHKDHLGRLGQSIKQALEQQRLRQQRCQADRRQALLLAVSRALANSHTLSEAAAKVLQAVGESSGWLCGGVWAVDAATNVVRCVETWMAPSTKFGEFETASRSMTYVPGAGLPGIIWISSKPIWVPNIAVDNNFPRSAAAAKDGLRGGLGFPIVIGSKVNGIFEFFSQDIAQPDEDLLQMFSGIGEQVGQFAERLEAEARLAHVLSSNPAVLYVMAVNGQELQLTWISDNVKEMMGYPIAEVFAPNWWLERVHPETCLERSAGSKANWLRIPGLPTSIGSGIKTEPTTGCEARCACFGMRRATPRKLSVRGPTSPIANSLRTNSASPKRWRQSASWPAAWPTISTTC